MRSDYYNCHHGSTAKELGWEDLNRFFSFLQAVVKGKRRRKKDIDMKITRLCTTYITIIIIEQSCPTQHTNILPETIPLQRLYGSRSHQHPYGSASAYFISVTDLHIMYSIRMLMHRDVRFINHRRRARHS